MAAADEAAGVPGDERRDVAALARRSALVVLAAGAGRRMGGVAKALLPIRRGAATGEGAEAGQGASETYLARIVATARAAGVRRGVAIVGAPHGAAVAALALALGLDVVENPQPERGMASSLELGFAWAAATGGSAATGIGDAEIETALLWPCDHPAVDPDTVRALFAAFAAATPSRAAVVPTVAGRGGHPALIARSLFAALARCAGLPEGARSVLRGAQPLRLPLLDRGCVADVDVPADAAEVT